MENDDHLLLCLIVLDLYLILIIRSFIKFTWNFFIDKLGDLFCYMALHHNITLRQFEILINISWRVLFFVIVYIDLLFNLDTFLQEYFINMCPENENYLSMNPNPVDEGRLRNIMGLSNILSSPGPSPGGGGPGGGDSWYSAYVVATHNSNANFTDEDFKHLDLKPRGGNKFILENDRQIYSQPEINELSKRFLSKDEITEIRQHLEQTREKNWIRNFKEAGISDEKSFKLMNTIKKVHPGLYHERFRFETEVQGSSRIIREEAKVMRVLKRSE